MLGLQGTSRASALKTHVDGLGPLVLVEVTVEDNVNTVVIHHLLHGLAHAFSLLVVSGVCVTPSS